MSDIQNATSSASLREFWNLPRPVIQPRYVFLESLFFDYFGSRAFSLLEIGVHTGELLKQLTAPSCPLRLTNYVGLDPYGASSDDYYLGAYWRSESEATDLYHTVKRRFEEHGYTLLRTQSHEYFSANERSFDLIYVDGDHRFAPTLWDLCHWFFRTTPDGILIVDDYGSVDHPEVTRAVNTFIELCESHIANFGYRSYEMYTATGNRRVPASKANVYFSRKSEVGSEEQHRISQQVEKLIGKR